MDRHKPVGLSDVIQITGIHPDLVRRVIENDRKRWFYADAAERLEIAASIDRMERQHALMMAANGGGGMVSTEQMNLIDAQLDAPEH